MKNQVFRKQVIALVMGSLMIFSGSAWAMKSHNQEFSNAGALINSELLMAQNEEQLSSEQLNAISQLVVKAKTVLGDIGAQLDSVAESDLPGKNTLSQVVANWETAIGNLGLEVDNKSLTKGEGEVIVQFIVTGATTIGDIGAQLETTAISEKGKAVAQNVVKASKILISHFPQPIINY